jgi:hypothetical protein
MRTEEEEARRLVAAGVLRLRLLAWKRAKEPTREVSRAERVQRYVRREESWDNFRTIITDLAVEEDAAYQ